MIIRGAVLKGLYGVSSEIPDMKMPEFVLAGRSNVGKSSFINRFIKRKNYAHTSQTPGKTRTINFYLVNSSFFLVDLPGYGYMKGSRAEQEVWGRMINRYLKTSDNIEEVILFVDMRHPPTAQDIQMFEFLKSATGYEPIVVLTKQDKLKKSELKVQEDLIRKSLGASSECEIIPFSAETGLGIEKIYALFDSILSEDAE